MIELIFDFFLGITSNMGYLGVFSLMAVESSFIPFPSEIVIPPAAYLAFQGEMNVSIVVLVGILGSLVGATVNYWIARSLGRVVIYDLVQLRWANYFLLSKRKVEYAERRFLEYGAISTFLGRLVPAVRQLISLPAGFVKMNFGSFLFFTALGSGFWVSILAALGYYFGENQDLLASYYREISMGAVLLVLIVLLILFLRRKR